MFVLPIIKRLFCYTIHLAFLSPIPASKFFNAIKSTMLRLMYVAIHSLLSFNGATNDDTNAGTLAAPFKTVGHAVSQIASGDTLYIRGGTYRDVIAGDNQVMMTLTNRTASTKTTIRNYNDEEVLCLVLGHYRHLDAARRAHLDHQHLE